MQLISDSLPSVGRSLVKLERKTEYHIAKLTKIEDVLKEKNLSRFCVKEKHQGCLQMMM
jgi:hypothetical protein